MGPRLTRGPAGGRAAPAGPSVAWEAVALTAPARHRFTIEDWDRLIELGFFTEDDRVELLDGEIVDMAPIGDRHASCVARLTKLFSDRFGSAAVVWVQNPVRTAGDSEPQPDVVLLAPRDDFYASGRPGPADVLLLVEVADTTVAFDRGPKAALYAAAGVAEYWVVDVGAETVECCLGPSSDGYRSQTVVGRGATLTPHLLATWAVPVDAVFGPR